MGIETEYDAKQVPLNQIFGLATRPLLAMNKCPFIKLLSDSLDTKNCAKLQNNWPEYLNSQTRKFDVFRGVW